MWSQTSILRMVSNALVTNVSVSKKVVTNVLFQNSQVTILSYKVKNYQMVILKRVIIILSVLGSKKLLIYFLGFNLV